jgi:hypothetical protein
MRQVFEAMVERGIVRSSRQFSVEWLGRARNYAADRGMDAISPEAKLTAFLLLRERGHADLASEVWKDIARDPRLRRPPAA